MNRYTAILSAVLLFFFAYITGTRDVYVMAYALVAMLLVDILYVYLQAKSLIISDVEIKCTYPMVGLPFSYTVRLRNIMRLPILKCQISMLGNMIEANQGTRELLFLTERTHTVTVNGVFNKRGIQTYGKVRLKIHGIFDIWTRQIVYGSSKTMCVYPHVYNVDSNDLLRLFGYRGLTLVGLDDPPEVAYLREYRRGDSFRHIHWPSSVKTSKLQTRVFEKERHGVMIVAAFSSEADNASSNSVKEFDALINVVASLAVASNNLGIPVGFAYDEVFLSPNNGFNIELLLEYLAVLEPKKEGLVVHEPAWQSLSDYTVLIISSKFADVHYDREYVNAYRFDAVMLQAGEYEQGLRNQQPYELLLLEKQDILSVHAKTTETGIYASTGK